MLRVILPNFRARPRHEVARAFLESMPFVSLLVVFFGVVSIIQDQEIFVPVIDAVLSLNPSVQPGATRCCRTSTVVPTVATTQCRAPTASVHPRPDERQHTRSSDHAHCSGRTRQLNFHCTVVQTPNLLVA